MSYSQREANSWCETSAQSRSKELIEREKKKERCQGDGETEQIPQAFTAAWCGTRTTRLPSKSASLALIAPSTQQALKKLLCHSVLRHPTACCFAIPIPTTLEMFDFYSFNCRCHIHLLWSFDKCARLVTP